MSKLIQELKKDEGLRLRAYQDHLGVWTIGYGTNLQVLEVTEGWAERKLRERVDSIRRQADQLPVFTLLSSTRKDVILSMMYQMGVQGTLNFRNMWIALEMGDYDAAAAEMRDSQWWRDPKTRNRAERMAVRMETGTW
jgi:lysozyme